MSQENTIYSEGFFPSENRWLFYRYWQTPKAKGDIIIIHGALDHSGRYKSLGNFFVKSGYNCYAFDLTGYGRSEGKRGYINYIDDYLVDMGNFYSFAREFKNMKNPFILGHNMGAILAILFATTGQCFIKGNVLTAPLFQFKNPPLAWKNAVTKFSNLLFPRVSLEYKINFEELSHDPNIAAEYAIDPFISTKVTARWICEIQRAMKKVQTRKLMVQIPSLILQGEHDSIANIEATKNFFAGLRCEKEFFLIRNAFHEVLNEVPALKIWQKILIWMNEHS